MLIYQHAMTVYCQLMEQNLNCSFLTESCQRPKGLQTLFEEHSQVHRQEILLAKVHILNIHAHTRTLRGLPSSAIPKRGLLGWRTHPPLWFRFRGR